MSNVTDQPLVTGRRAVVLLIEDDRGDQELTRRALEGDVLVADLRVVEDGQVGLDYLMRRGAYSNPEDAPRPDLILLDLNLPKVDGLEVLEKIRADEELRTIPVVVLTTSADQAEVRRNYELGCNSFLTKPVEFESFIELVRGLGRYWLELVTLPPQDRS